MPLTVSWFRSERLAGVTGRSRASLVDGDDSELVLIALNKSGNGALAVGRVGLERLLPHGGVLVLLLDDVARDRGATVRDGLLPDEVHVVLIPVLGLRGAGCLGSRCKERSTSVLFFTFKPEIWREKKTQWK